MSTIASSASRVATTEGTPRARSHPITGENAHAMMSASISGMTTTVSCRMPQITAATTITTTMIWMARVASIPNPSVQSRQGARLVCSSARDGSS